MRSIYLSSLAIPALAFSLAACSSATAEAGPALQLAGAESVSFSGDEIEIEDFIGTIVIETGPGMTLSATLESGVAVAAGELDAPVVRRTKNGVSVEGDDRAKVRNCNTSNGSYHLQIKGHSKRPLSDFPVLRMTAPSNADLDLEIVAGLATIGDVAEADAGVSGCGDITLANVAGELEAGVNGSGDIAAGDVGALSAAIRGSGDIRVGEVAGEAEMSIAGSGDIAVGRVGGEMELNIAGSGDIRAAGGAGELEVNIHGSGDVRIEDGAFGDAELNIAGSGDIRIDGEVRDLAISIAGSGDIRVATATGEVDVSRFGGGDIYVNDKRWTKKGWVAK